MRWRVLVDPPATGSRNMAVDHALAACSSPGEAVLRIYQWGRPTVSFGRNEPARDHYGRERQGGRGGHGTVHDGGFDFVRRPTGGRAVLHDRELTYSVVLPLNRGGVTGRGGSLRATYGLINQGLIEALRLLGVPAALAEQQGPPAALDSGPCFERPAPGEVIARGRKLVGSAQARSGGAILQHGSLLLGPGQERLREIESNFASRSTGGHPEGPGGDGRVQVLVAPQTGPISLSEVLGREPSWSHVVEAVISALKQVTGGEWQRDDLTELERVKSVALEERYASPEWTWRR